MDCCTVTDLMLFMNGGKTQENKSVSFSNHKGSLFEAAAWSPGNRPFMYFEAIWHVL